MMVLFKDKDAWAAALNAFQRPDGFFNNTGSDGKHPGGTLWHAAGARESNSWLCLKFLYMFLIHEPALTIS